MLLKVYIRMKIIFVRSWASQPVPSAPNFFYINTLLPLHFSDIYLWNVIVQRVILTVVLFSHFLLFVSIHCISSSFCPWSGKTVSKTDAVLRRRDRSENKIKTKEWADVDKNMGENRNSTDRWLQCMYILRNVRNGNVANPTVQMFSEQIRTRRKWEQRSTDLCIFYI